MDLVNIFVQSDTVFEAVCRRVNDRSGMKAHSGEVGVFVRIRPTANFAQQLIECLPDGQVTSSTSSLFYHHYY